MNKKTFEEAAEMDETVAWELAKKRFEEIEGYAPDINNRTHELMVASLQEGILAGAKWQQEQDKNKYSKEDMELAFIAGGNSNITEDDGYGSRYLKYMDKWFEQFKKK